MWLLFIQRANIIDLISGRLSLQWWHRNLWRMTLKQSIALIQQLDVTLKCHNHGSHMKAEYFTDFLENLFIYFFNFTKLTLKSYLLRDMMQVYYPE